MYVLYIRTKKFNLHFPHLAELVDQIGDIHVLAVLGSLDGLVDGIVQSLVFLAALVVEYMLHDLKHIVRSLFLVLSYEGGSAIFLNTLETGCKKAGYKNNSYHKTVLYQEPNHAICPVYRSQIRTNGMKHNISLAQKYVLYPVCIV